MDVPTDMFYLFNVCKKMINIWNLPDIVVTVYFKLL